MPSSRFSVEPGDILAGKYRVERVLGKGGMGVVLAATNLALKQNVAIKLLLPDAIANEEALGRFKREARAAARLRSEHVARPIDIGELENGRPFIVMEMLHGRDLGSIIESGPAPGISEAVEWVLQACEAIAEAHGVGVIHRDLKPKNLFLTTTVAGRPLVKVLDFGISKVDRDSGHMQLTRTTQVIGSPSYMSPEQLRSARNVDARTDIWALGVILYELLSGRLPFDAETMTELVLVVATEQETPVHELRPDVPLALSQVVSRCLAKRPEDRFEDVGALASALGPFASGVVTTAADRVRAVALKSSRALMETEPSGPQPALPEPSEPVRAPGAPSAIGGTSVAWGPTQETRAQAPAPAPALAAPVKRRSRAKVAFFAVGATVASAAIAVAGTHLGKRPAAPTASGQPVVSETLPATARKELPLVEPAPRASMAEAPLASTPAPQASTPAAPSASASSRTRRVSRPAPAPKTAATPPADELSGIGRR